MCKSCQLPKCTPEPQRLEKPLLSSTAASGWDCPTCMVKNKSDVDKCVCCQTANPKKSDVQGNNGGASVSFNGHQGENNTWKCPSCLVIFCMLAVIWHGFLVVDRMCQKALRFQTKQFQRQFVDANFFSFSSVEFDMDYVALQNSGADFFIGFDIE